MYSSYQAVVFVEKKSTSPKITWRVQEVTEVFHKFISNARCVGPQLPHLLEKFPGETSTGAEDYVAKEVFWLRWGWMFYLSTIKGIDPYGILALEKLIYFLGGLVASGDLHAIYIYIYIVGERERESSCVVHIWCSMWMITVDVEWQWLQETKKSSKPSTKLQRCMMAVV